MNKDKFTCAHGHAVTTNHKSFFQQTLKLIIKQHPPCGGATEKFKKNRPCSFSFMFVALVYVRNT